ncbi:MAG: anaerobic ribonucleoside-triphosphate reductase activating protein [Oscillospiraceae bacterium]|nr:anaerobic ribonucleoside-triphosphate reductase activating protein [Oscillospiraceae bacterium]MBQ9695440.1 anaerobic ribonucleoside-triphosphate reductase activating protein [Oscillospiraceae bacterium]MBR1899355.1 anaerobic ribonucleoside-triphosphate reductase activating protein [Oscillospiraceae bacterium]
MQLRINATVDDSIVDGPGIRYSIFVQGCPHHCPGCHNPQTHPFEGGSLVETDKLLADIKLNPLLDGVTFSGGEPFCQAAALAELGREIRKLGLNIMTYSGFTFEQLYERRDQDGIGDLLAVTDVLVDGRFMEDLRSLELRFRGSSNQRIIDVPASLAAGHAVERTI